jgi:GAF domain-containing protein
VVTHSRAPADQSHPEETSTAPRSVDAASTSAATAATAATFHGSPDAGRGVSAVIQTLVLDSEAVHDFLDRLAHFVADHLSTSNRTILCGVTLIRALSATTVASSSAHAQTMDEVQYSFGDGPCLDAARNHHTNYIPDVADVSDDSDGGARWPEYRAVVAEHGLHSILSVPVPLDPTGGSGCAINVYADTAHAFSAADIETTKQLAQEAANTVHIAVRIAHLADTAENLRAAMDSRTDIDLAAGIIMAQNRCSQDTAVTILKAASSARNLRLHDLAIAIIASITTESTSTHFDN